MTKKDKKDISAAIKGLPVVTDPNIKIPRVISGSGLIGMGVFKTKSGEPVVRSKQYTIKEDKVINHRTEAEKAFKTGGMTAVLLYCNEVLSKTKKALLEVNK